MLTQQDASFTVIALLLAPLLCMRQDLGRKEGKARPDIVTARIVA